VNEQNYKRRPQSSAGGADMRGRVQNPSKTREQRLSALQMGQAHREEGHRPEYTQMPLRPMTAMPRERRRTAEPRPAAQGQRPPVQGQRPPAQGQRPAAQGQRPPVQGQRPPVQGQRPPVKGQQRPQRPPERKRPPAKRPDGGWVIPEGSPVYTAEGRMYEGRRPPQNGAPEGRRPQGNAPKRGANQPPRRPAPKKKKKIFNKEKFVFWTKTFFVRLLTMLLIVSLLGFWWYRAEFYSKNDSRSGKVSVTLEGVDSYETKASVAYRGDVLYCDFTQLCKWFGMVSVGSVNSMRFICTEGVCETSSGVGGEEYAIFTSGSTTVIVNGTSMSLEAPCRTVDSHIWIPLSFVENYVSGVVCDRGAKGTNIVITPEGFDELEEDEELVINASFKFKAQNALKSVEYPE